MKKIRPVFVIKSVCWTQPSSPPFLLKSDIVLMNHLLSLMFVETIGMPLPGQLT